MTLFQMAYTIQCECLITTVQQLIKLYLVFFFFFLVAESNRNILLFPNHVHFAEFMRLITIERINK